MTAVTAAKAFARDKGVKWVLFGWSIFTVENLFMCLGRNSANGDLG